MKAYHDIMKSLLTFFPSYVRNFAPGFIMLRSIYQKYMQITHLMRRPNLHDFIQI